MFCEEGHLKDPKKCREYGVKPCDKEHKKRKKARNFRGFSSWQQQMGYGVSTEGSNV